LALIGGLGLLDLLLQRLTGSRDLHDPQVALGPDRAVVEYKLLKAAVVKVIQLLLQQDRAAVTGASRKVRHVTPLA